MDKQLIFVGGGHAHLYALQRIAEYVQRGVQVTLIAPDHFWYSGMGPGLLSGIYGAEDDRVDVGEMVRRAGGAVLTDKVVHIDGAKRELRLAGGHVEPYDVVSLNVGSDVALDLIPGAEGIAVPVKPVKHFLNLRRRMQEGEGRLRVMVIGGGAAGCEAAANCIRLCADVGRPLELFLVSSAEVLLAGHPPKAGRFMEQWFRKRGVDVRLGQRVERVSEGDADVVIVATGVRPSRLPRDSGLATAADGSMQVRDTLQSRDHPEIFGGGDCIQLMSNPLERVGVYAVRQGPILFHNLAAQLTGEPLKTFTPQEHYLLILNLGDGTGLVMWRGMVFHGRWAFRFKDWLDRRFIRQFQ